MSFELKILEHDGWGDNVQRRFHFAVVDLGKAENYPLNFVCMLPVNLGSKQDSVFLRIFGSKSLEQARTLLNDALKTENNAKIKVEIERRLKLLDPVETQELNCSLCGKLFRRTRTRRYKRNLCSDCAGTLYGSQ